MHGRMDSRSACCCRPSERCPACHKLPPHGRYLLLCRQPKFLKPMRPQGPQHRYAIPAIRRECLDGISCPQAGCQSLLPYAARRYGWNALLRSVTRCHLQHAPAPGHLGSAGAHCALTRGARSIPSKTFPRDSSWLQQRASLPACAARLMPPAPSDLIAHDMTMSGLQPSTCTKCFIFKLLQRRRSLDFARSGQAGMIGFAIMAAALGLMPSRSHHSWKAGIRNIGSC